MIQRTPERQGGGHRERRAPGTLKAVIPRTPERQAPETVAARNAGDGRRHDTEDARMPGWQAPEMMGARNAEHKRRWTASEEEGYFHHWPELRGSTVGL